jgi:hypothetical protein
MLWLQLLITAVLTTLIVKGALWIKRHRHAHPGLYKNRSVIGAMVWLILNF